MIPPLLHLNLLLPLNILYVATSVVSCGAGVQNSPLKVAILTIVRKSGLSRSVEHLTTS